MFHNLLAFLTFRSILILASSIFSVIFIMIVLNIMTIDEAIAILRLSPEMADTFRSVICRSRELASGLIDILAQIFNKLFAWAGHDVDFSKLNIGGDAGCKLHNNNINNPDLNGLYDRLTEGAKGAKEVMEQKK